ncbi:hypothetical protein [uncultured Hyphomonas sp.]|uniref:hypothetical protein n=1 Tax=uncultured Hyphomonas sp. TaxID=225298 RepID=UPI000C61ADEE|nr:hypothetical protein [Hyphomonadaceae bacterium]
MPGQTQPEPYHYGRSTAHDDLQATLLHWLANQSGRAAWGEIDLDGARADAYAVEIVRRKLVNPHIYEVKAARSDFTGEMRTGKWRKYLPWCCRFDFVTPAGLCERSEIPEEAGWLVLEDGNFRRRKRAQVREASVPDWFLLRVALHRAPHMPVGRAWVERQWIDHIRSKRRLGAEVANFIRNKAKAHAELYQMKARVADLRAEFYRLKAAEAHPDFATSDLFENPLEELK